MKKYYSIGISDDLKIIGYYPQTSLAKGYNPRENGCYDVNANYFPNFVPNYELDLHEKAKATNLLPRTGASFGHVVDEKVKKILKEHYLPPHAFYPMKVYHKGKILKYFWFHCIPNDFWDLIDTSESYADIIKIKLAKASIKGNVPIISKEQIETEKKKYTGLEMLVLGHLKMSSEFLKYDFYITGAFNHTIISERLKQTFEKEEITGVKIKPFEKFVISK